jgi:hypothetical protein
MSDTLSDAGQGAVNELMGALAKAQAEMSNATFNQENPAFKGSRYADLASIRDATIPHLAKYGLSIHQVTKLNGAGMLLVTRLAHSSGQWIVSEYPIPVSDRPHVMGSAITYARRYSWAAITGIAAEKDDDGNDAQEGAKNGTKSLPALPARKSSAAAKRDKDWEKFEAALRDCQSAREVEKLRAEYMTDVYPMWNVDWRDAATEALNKRQADFSQPGALKQTLEDSIEATDEQTTKFHECWEWLAGATTLNEIISRADNLGYREGLKTLTKEQVAQLRALFKARREDLGMAAA